MTRIQSQYLLVLNYSTGKRMSSRQDKKSKELAKKLEVVLRNLLQFEYPGIVVKVNYKRTDELEF